ncbi:MAG: tungsten ABC transporter substrate-binding protein [Planctomycetaceae bacterium]|nr:tungsten ABC transporter substrate-binding protein [Planctomycetaceae bacterium]
MFVRVKKSILTASFVCLAIGCHTFQQGQPTKLRIAVTSSTFDSGLFDRLIPLFETQHNVAVDVIVAGSEKSLKLGKQGNVDLVWVHARTAEDEFMAAGDGIRREDVMYNTFEILGPASDPAGVRGGGLTEALQAISRGQYRFISRGDRSGTHQRELSLWTTAGEMPNWEQYIKSNQGMGPTLVMADQKDAYVLADRGTYLKFKDKINLVPLVQSPEELANPYGILVVNPAKHPAIKGALAQKFVDFLISPATQRLIREYKIEGEQLFYPLHLAATE